MNAQRIAGTVAVVSGGAILILALVLAVVSPAWTGWTMGTPRSGAMMGPGMMGPGMMGSGFGTGMMSGAMGPEMMGMGMGTGMMSGAMGPGMMGPGHMGSYAHRAVGTTAPIEGAPTVRVTASDLRFSPTEIALASQAANLTLTNEGQVIHDLTIPALGVRVVARPGETATIGLRDLPAGRYAGYCGVPGHAEAGMRIAVVVQ